MILFDRVNFRYNEKPETSFVVKEVSFSCPKGMINGIVGTNGCGKSTVLKLIAGLIHPSQGKLTVDEIEPGSHSIKNRFLAGMIFQNTDNQIVGTTVEEDLAFGLENMGIEPIEMQRRVKEIAVKFKIDHLLQTPAYYLSGGQKQLLCIASVMVMQPMWVLFDEPTSHLDPWSRLDFWEIIRSLVRDSEIGVVIVSQLPEDLQHFDRIIAMHNGSVVYEGLVEELKKNPHAADIICLPESWKYRDLIEKTHG